MRSLSSSGANVIDNGKHPESGRPWTTTYFAPFFNNACKPRFFFYIYIRIKLSSFLNPIIPSPFLHLPPSNRIWVDAASDWGKPRGEDWVLRIPITESELFSFGIEREIV